MLYTAVRAIRLLAALWQALAEFLVGCPVLSLLEQRVHRALIELGGDPGLVAARNLPTYSDALELVVADTSQSGIEHRLTPEAARTWQSMKKQAASEQVSLILVSGYRSFERQFAILRHRLERGESIDRLLARLAPPGCSQHHTGRALDIGTQGCEPASLAFAETRAFDWLNTNAGEFGFQLSYPPDNPYGYLYEPWHWFMLEQTEER